MGGLNSYHASATPFWNTNEGKPDGIPGFCVKDYERALNQKECLWKCKTETYEEDNTIDYKTIPETR